ncbi:MAG: efflux RND transporter periplasmic adaptor subunit [Alphaproteobacteria bacterium]|nr:efflux RND transporter periplasmic adaptor subunit [Alphaproteobacteria bacterium]MBM3625039.1 efflux RND transporter periplasmic adaptor subunit [Alphaproteobacteria bacterium]
MTLSGRVAARVGVSRERVVSALLKIFAALLYFAQAAEAQAEGPAPEVVVSRPLARTIPNWDEYTGRFEPLKQVEVRARVSGALEKINFTDGQFVKAGDVLFVIDQRPYQIAVDSARAELARAQAQAAMSSRDYARAQEMTQGRTITARDVDQRRASSDIAKAQVLSAEAALRNAELNLEWTQVRAPISGRVSDRRVDPGNLVQGGQAGATLLTTIVTLDPIHFVFDASEADYIRYARAAERRKELSHELKNPVSVRLADETEWTRSGVMDFLDNQINRRSGTIRGRAIFDNKDYFLTPGAFGRLRLFSGDMSALLIPDAAVVSDQTSKTVLVVSDDNKVVAKSVTLGAIHRGLRVIQSGLGAKDRIVIGGLANPMVRPGAAVQPKDGEIKEAPVAVSDR